jgi:polygalacturonase
MKIPRMTPCARSAATAWIRRVSSAGALLLGAAASLAQAEATTAIAPGPNASHVVAIDGDKVEVAAGITYSFTVDTPADKGLVSTVPNATTLLGQIVAADGSRQTYRITGKDGADKTAAVIETGDRLVVTAADGKAARTYGLELKPAALTGQLRLERDAITVNTARDIRLFFTAGQRSPDASVRIELPAGIQVSLDNTTVNVIGRGEVTLRDLPSQSIGRVGSAYSYSKVGEVEIAKGAKGAAILTFKHLDLRPSNGADLEIRTSGVQIAKAGAYVFRATYTTAQPEVLTSAAVGPAVATLTAGTAVSDFARVVDRSLRYEETPATYTSVSFTWTARHSAPVRMMHSTDEGKTWQQASAQVDPLKRTASITGLAPDTLHTFRLQVDSGANKGASNPVYFYSGKLDVKSRGALGDGTQDDTDKINAAIAHLADLGGGTLLFSEGTYNVRTVHLRSNVYLYVDRGATILAIKGGDAPEATWFSDLKYRHGLSPTDAGPYEDSENWLTKQDVGHHYFRNSMFFGERLDNVKIIGNGRISGNGVLATSDNVMRNPPGSRCDKIFTLKLCTNVEIGGIIRDEDLWYDPAKDEPYYIEKDGAKSFDVSNMLQIDRGGHFVLLATGTDNIHVHDSYFSKHSQENARDIYDFMQCNDVTVTNVYSKLSSDDIVKLGSDSSLGFTRPVKGCRVRNVIGDTYCNLFQIGSETVDDIKDVHVDNIYVLGANKAGFSISTNDGGHVQDVHLNCGHTGPLHSRSKMVRTRTPFFISISNRGRALGATVARHTFDENGKLHKDELLNSNIDIGTVENVTLNGIDVTEMYSGSSFRAPRWKAYDGTQASQAPIIAGYALPLPEVVEGGALSFTLPNGKHTGYIKNVAFNDVHFLAKGGNPKSDAERLPPELGVGQYNAANLGVLPAYGMYVRHVEGLTLTNCSFGYEKRDSRPAILLEDVVGARMSDVKLVRAEDQPSLVKLRGSRDIAVERTVYFEDIWDKAPVELPAAKGLSTDVGVAAK